MERDYSHIFLGLVIFSGVIAMLLMVTSGDAPQQNTAGAATGGPTGIAPISFDELQIPGKVVTVIESSESTVTLNIDDEERVYERGQTYRLDPRRTIRFAQNADEVYVFDIWDAQSCDGITGQTRATSPNNICCDGQSVPLPDCTQDAEPIQCGDKRIYCEEGTLKSEGAQ